MFSRSPFAADGSDQTDGISENVPLPQPPPSTSVQCAAISSTSASSYANSAGWSRPQILWCSGRSSDFGFLPTRLLSVPPPWILVCLDGIRFSFALEFDKSSQNIAATASYNQQEVSLAV